MSLAILFCFLGVALLSTTGFLVYVATTNEFLDEVEYIIEPRDSSIFYDASHFFVILPTFSVFIFSDFIPLGFLAAYEANESCSLFFLCFNVMSFLPLNICVLFLLIKVFITDRSNLDKATIKYIIEDSTWDYVYTVLIGFMVLSPIFLTLILIFFPVERCNEEIETKQLGTSFSICFIILHIFYSLRFSSFLSFKQENSPDKLDLLRGMFCVLLGLFLALLVALFQLTSIMRFIAYCCIAIGTSLAKFGLLFNLHDTTLFFYDDFLNNFSRRGIYNHKKWGLSCRIDTGNHDFDDIRLDDIRDIDVNPRFFRDD